MAHVIRMRRNRHTLISVRTLLIGGLVVVAIGALAASYRDQLGEMTSTFRPDRSITSKPAANALPTVIKLGQPPPSALEGGIDPSRIVVIDGDTVRVDGKNYRLVGFNTPESCSNSKCLNERDLATRAARRLREIVAGGNLLFERVS
jgi:endonuclease YncB( thermonuclease family)